jgi:hypothetical protein
VAPDRWDEWNADLQKPFRKGRRFSIIAALWRSGSRRVVHGAERGVIYTAIIYAAMIAYFALYSRATTSSPRRRRST